MVSNFVEAGEIYDTKDCQDKDSKSFFNLDSLLGVISLVGYAIFFMLLLCSNITISIALFALSAGLVFSGIFLIRMDIKDENFGWDGLLILMMVFRSVVIFGLGIGAFVLGIRVIA